MLTVDGLLDELEKVVHEAAEKDRELTLQALKFQADQTEEEVRRREEISLEVGSAAWDASRADPRGALDLMRRLIRELEQPPKRRRRRAA
jgi:hypothetical protein